MSATAQTVQQMLSSSRRNAYTYIAPVVASLAAAATAANALQFDTDALFVWTKTSYHADLAAAAITESAYPIPLVTVQIQDISSQRTLFSAPAPIEDVAGYRGLPFILPAPQIVTPGASLKFSYTNFSAATTYTNLQLLLHGFKLYGQLNAQGELVPGP